MNRPYKVAAAVLVAALCVVALLYAAVTVPTSTVAPKAKATTPAAPVTPVPDPSELPTPVPFGPPVRIVAPVAGIDAAVQTVDLDGGNVATPSDEAHGVAWYDKSGLPGSNNRAFLDCHANYLAGPLLLDGECADLDQLQVGDEIDVYENGLELPFFVTQTKVVPATSGSGQFLIQTDPASLVLITCDVESGWSWNDGTYNGRFAVIASLPSAPQTNPVFGPTA